MKKTKALKCKMCGKNIEGEYLQANVDENLKPTAEGAVVCSTECASKYLSKIPYGGNVIQHWSRITGYYQNVAGWNKGKLAELKDRKRYGVGEVDMQKNGKKQKINHT